MPLRDRLTYSNVVATLALVVAVGTGGAYAAGEIGSRDIDNNSVRSIDLKNRHAVKARDVKRNALTGKEIDERSLRAAAFAPIAGAEGISNCDPTDAEFVDCASADVNVSARSRLLIIATGDFFSFGPGADRGLSCRIETDGVDSGIASNPGEMSGNTSLALTDGFALTHVTDAVRPGTYEVELACSEPGAADGRLATSTIAVLGISR